MSVHRNSFRRVKQQILKIGHLGAFAAHAERGASRSLRRLFALVAKH
jgi:hypothetical protein